MRQIFAARNRPFQLGCFVFLLTVATFGHGRSEPPKLDLIKGPATVTLGSEIGQIVLDKKYVFAKQDDAKKIMELMGNLLTNKEVGLVMPQSSKEDWFVLFEYNPVGYIRDNEKDNIDSARLLESIQRATAASNKTRKERGFPGLHVLGWHEPPHYDPQSNNLVWAILAKDDNGNETVNYNIRMLGRHGYMSVVLVADPPQLAELKPDVQSIITNFSYKKGKSYAEFVQGDKIAEYGLTALVAGGAGAAAAKLGFFSFLAKYAKALVFGLLALLAGIWKFIKSTFVREETISYPQ